MSSAYRDVRGGSMGKCFQFSLSQCVRSQRYVGASPNCEESISWRVTDVLGSFEICLEINLASLSLLDSLYQPYSLKNTYWPRQTSHGGVASLSKSGRNLRLVPTASDRVRDIVSERLFRLLCGEASSLGIEWFVLCTQG